MAPQCLFQLPWSHLPLQEITNRVKTGGISSFSGSNVLTCNRFQKFQERRFIIKRCRIIGVPNPWRPQMSLGPCLTIKQVIMHSWCPMTWSSRGLQINMMPAAAPKLKTVSAIGPPHSAYIRFPLSPVYCQTWPPLSAWSSNFPAYRCSHEEVSALVTIPAGPRGRCICTALLWAASQSRHPGSIFNQQKFYNSHANLVDQTPTFSPELLKSLSQPSEKQILQN